MERQAQEIEEYKRLLLCWTSRQTCGSKRQTRALTAEKEMAELKASFKGASDIDDIEDDDDDDDERTNLDTMDDLDALSIATSATYPGHDDVLTPRS